MHSTVYHVLLASKKHCSRITDDRRNVFALKTIETYLTFLFHLRIFILFTNSSANKCINVYFQVLLPCVSQSTKH
jgi:hypothetical protein